MPIYQMKSIPEQFTQLRKALGFNASTIHKLSLVGRWYHDDKFVIGMDTEKTLQAGWTGISTKAGDLLTIKMENVGTSAGTTPKYAEKVFVTLSYDAILQIQDSGVTVLE